MLKTGIYIYIYNSILFVCCFNRIMRGEQYISMNKVLTLMHFNSADQKVGSPGSVT